MAGRRRNRISTVDNLESRRLLSIALDTSFSAPDGYELMPNTMVPRLNASVAVALQPSTTDPAGYKILIGADVSRSAWDGGNTGSDFGVRRLSSDGTLDAAFRSLDAPTSQDDAFSGLIVNPDGSYITAGSFAPSGSQPQAKKTLVLFKHHADGTVDSKFGKKGRFDYGPQEGKSDIRRIPAALTRLADGDLLVLTSVTNVTPNPDQFWAELIRVNPNGTLDTAFGGGDGSVVLNTPNSANSAGGLVVHPDGRITVLLKLSANGIVDGEHYALAQLTPGGSLVGTFGGGDGLATGGAIGDGDGTTREFWPTGLHLHEDRLWVTGNYGGGESIVVAFDPTTGAPDRTFNPAHPVEPAGRELPWGGAALTIAPDGRLYQFGNEWHTDPLDGQEHLRMRMIRLHADFTIDEDAHFDLAPGAADNWALSGVTFLDGGARFLVAGTNSTGSTTRYAVSRFASSSTSTTSAAGLALNVAPASLTESRDAVPTDLAGSGGIHAPFASLVSADLAAVQVAPAGRGLPELRLARALKSRRVR